MEYITAPMEIEHKSMDIIDGYLTHLSLSNLERAVYRRIIHATGDPDYRDIIVISPGALEQTAQALKEGKKVIVDVNMVKTGINSRVIKRLGGEILCKIADEDVVKRAGQTGETRAMTAFKILENEMTGAVIAVGNAPTALFHVLKRVREGKIQPACVVGVPVGFVGAAESKAELEKANIPFVTVRGNKGGSSVAAAIVNAVLYQIETCRD